MDRFIVGTGRCGSTLLSRMLAENPATLSIFEYFNGLDVLRRFAPEPIDGAAFAELIAAEQPFVTAVLRRGYEVAEITYPFRDPATEGSGAGLRCGRRGRDEALPWILVSMLPRLSDDPDALFDEVIAFARPRPPLPVTVHHRALFGWLCDRLGREHWIERAGSSIDYVGALAEHFPEARFLHLHRDGREAALSMREHHAYRLPIAVLYRSGDDEVPAVGPEDLRAVPEGRDPVSRILRMQPPVAYYGRYWSDQVRSGVTALRAIDGDRHVAVRFEELCARPRETLLAICSFFDIEPERDGWLERATALVRGVPPTRFEALPERERAILDEACAPGRALLGQGG